MCLQDARGRETESSRHLSKTRWRCFPESLLQSWLDCRHPHPLLLCGPRPEFAAQLLKLLPERCNPRIAEISSNTIQRWYGTTARQVLLQDSLHSRQLADRLCSAFPPPGAATG